jgi:hypothetical protein
MKKLAYPRPSTAVYVISPLPSAIDTLASITMPNRYQTHCTKARLLSPRPAQHACDNAANGNGGVIQAGDES